MGVDWYTFLATLDFRTCAVCGALDGKHFRVSEAQTGTNLPPMHPNDRCTTVAYYPGEEETGTRAAKDPDTGKSYKVPANMTYEQWRKEISEKHGADTLDTARKKYYNHNADASEYRSVHKILGKGAPETFADYQNLKYNKFEKWEQLKQYRQYKEKYPQAQKVDFEIYKELESLGIKNGIVLPPEKVTSYILEDPASKDPAHIMKRMFERNITDDQVHSYVENASVMFDQWKGARKAFYSQDGVTIVTKSEDNWIAKTTWSKFDFDEDTEKIMEVIKKHVKG